MLVCLVCFFAQQKKTPLKLIISDTNKIGQNYKIAEGNFIVLRHIYTRTSHVFIQGYAAYRGCGTRSDFGNLQPI